MRFKDFKQITESQFNSKQEVIDHFVKQGKSAASGAAAWERGWRGSAPKKKSAPSKPTRSYHDDLDDKRYGEHNEGVDELEQALAEAALGINAKRPARSGSRPPRGHNAVSGYKTHISPDGVKTNMSPTDDDYQINYGPGGAVAADRKARGVDVATGNKKVAEGEETLNIGDDVVIVGNSAYEGKPGRVIGFKDGKIVVDLAEHGKVRFVPERVKLYPLDKQGVAEISKPTLGRYIKAAGKDVEQRASSQSFKSGQAGDKYNKADTTHKDTRREKGIDRALDKLTREQCDEEELEEWKASRKLCMDPSKSDDEIGASALSSCKSQGFRARDGKKSHKVGSKRITVGGKKIKGKAYGGPLPDYGTRK